MSFQEKAQKNSNKSLRALSGKFHHNNRYSKQATTGILSPLKFKIRPNNRIRETLLRSLENNLNLILLETCLTYKKVEQV